MRRSFKIESMGDEVAGIRIKGDPRTPEPASFRICFPGGDVEVVRASDGAAADYWIHVRVNDDNEQTIVPGAVAGRIVDARLGIRGKHASDANVGDFGDSDLYHLAVRVRRVT